MGLLTNAGIVVALITAVAIFGLQFMVEAGNEYGVSLEDKYYNKFGTGTNNGDIKGDQVSSDLIYNAVDLQEGSDLDNEAQDSAQNPGSISGYKSSLNTFTILKGFMVDLQKIIPFNSQVGYYIMAAVAFAFFAALAALFFKRIV